MDQVIVSTIVPQNTGHAWEYYFNQINKWWPQEFFTSPKTKKFVIETYVGGKVYEDYGEGDGLEWGQVIKADFLHSLIIQGFLIREFGGPAMTYETYTFSAVDSGTEVKYTLDPVGNGLSDKTLQQLKGSWEQLLGVHFKNYCSNR